MLNLNIVHKRRIHFFINLRNDRRSQAVRFVRSRDPKEREIAFRDYPELRKIIPVINLVREGFGSYKEIMSMREEQIEELTSISEILAILNQEEELDNAHNRRRS